MKKILNLERLVMILLKNLNKTYGNNRVVNNINVEKKQGGIIGFLGPNGAGKTTTIKMMTGVLKPDSGTVLINGKDIIKNGIEAKMEIGYVPDNSGMFLKLNGMEYLKFVAGMYRVPVKKRDRLIGELTEKFKLESELADKIQSYSRGMRQKLVIIGSLLHEPNVWILDEPLTGLDPQAVYTLKELMRDYANLGKTVFFSTHLLDVAEKICDTLIVINKGEIIYDGDKNDLHKSIKAGSSFEKIFLEMTSDE